MCAGSRAASAGNPYSFHRSIAACAAAERNRCESITGTGDGDAECVQLAADDGRGYSLICVNLALAIDAVASCAARRAPSCPRDIHASESIAKLDANAGFVDDPACAEPLDACLERVFGERPDLPGPGGGSSPPRDPPADCGDSCSGDSSYDDSGCDDGCDAVLACEADGSEDGCSDSGDPGADPGTDSCSGDTEDSCGSEDNTGCSDSEGGDCGGGGGESDCGSSADGGGDCEGGGGGGDCEGGGGGGDCSSSGGGGGDCNVAGTRGHAGRGGRGASLPVAVAWALLPLPFAIIVRRRAERRRARAAWDAERAP